MVILKLTSNAIDSTVHINTESINCYWYNAELKSTVIEFSNGKLYPYKETCEDLDKIFTNYITLFNPMFKKTIRINPKSISSYWKDTTKDVSVHNTILQFKNGRQYAFKDTPEEIDALLESK